MPRITVNDLRDQIGVPGPHAFLKCFTCGAEYSANAGDYFMAKSTHVFRCCRRNMSLVTRSVIYEEDT